MKEKLIAGLILLAVLTQGCQEVMLPDVEETEPYLVVEAKITTSETVHAVYLNYSKTFDYRLFFYAVYGATVEVHDEEGNSVTFYESDDINGHYYTDPADNFRAEIGKTYTLVITTADGLVYESTPQTVVESAEIKDLYCEYGKDSQLTEDSYGDPQLIVKEGINIVVETDGILPANNYYLYSWQGYEEHHCVLYTGGPSNLHLFCHRNLHPKYYNILKTGNADEFGNFEMRNQKIFFIATEDMTDYVPEAADSMELLSSIFDGLLLRMEQYSLSADAYEYISGAEDQLSAVSRLFDPAITQLKGNIKCVSDPEQKVVGVFYAADVQMKYAYLYIDYQNETLSEIIPGFPELFLDTCAVNTRPDDWYLSYD